MMLLVCDICADRSLDVRPGLAAWRDPAQPYSAIDRCQDVAACRARVAASGEPWPIVEPSRKKAS